MSISRLELETQYITYQSDCQARARREIHSDAKA